MITTAAQRQDPRNMYDDSEIDRPSSCFSDDEDFRPSGDGAESLTSLVRVCHSCGSPSTTRKACQACGHAYCHKCVREIPGYVVDQSATPRNALRSANDATTESLAIDSIAPSLPGQAASELIPRPASGLSYHSAGINSPKPTLRSVASSTAFKNNPFIIADLNKCAFPEPHTTNQATTVRRPTRPSDCVPSQHSFVPYKSLASPEKCIAQGLSIFPSCGNETCHTSGSTAADAIRDEPETVQSRDINAASQDHSASILEDTLERKIDRLFQEAEELYRAQHIMDHLVGGADAIQTPSGAAVDAPEVAAKQDPVQVGEAPLSVPDCMSYRASDISSVQSVVAGADANLPNTRRALKAASPERQESFASRARKDSSCSLFAGLDKTPAIAGGNPLRFTESTPLLVEDAAEAATVSDHLNANTAYHRHSSSPRLAEDLESQPCDFLLKDADSAVRWPAQKPEVVSQPQPVPASTPQPLTPQPSESRKQSGTLVEPPPTGAHSPQLTEAGQYPRQVGQSPIANGTGLRRVQKLDNVAPQTIDTANGSITFGGPLPIATDPAPGTLRKLGSNLRTYRQASQQPDGRGNSQRDVKNESDLSVPVSNHDQNEQRLIFQNPDPKNTIGGHVEEHCLPCHSSDSRTEEVLFPGPTRNETLETGREALGTDPRAVPPTAPTTIEDAVSQYGASLGHVNVIVPPAAFPPDDGREFTYKDQYAGLADLTRQPQQDILPKNDIVPANEANKSLAGPIQAPGEGAQDHVHVRDDSVPAGIDGFTIVLHLQGQDDLVVKADLKAVEGR